MLLDPETRESTKKELEERFGITDNHQEVIDTFIHNYYEKSPEEVRRSGLRTLRDAVRLVNTDKRISQSLSSDEFFSDINTPTLTSPEQPFNINQASIDVKRLFSTLRTTNVDGSVNPITVPENNRSSEGEPTQNLPELSDVFNIEFVRLMMGNQQPFIFK